MKELVNEEHNTEHESNWPLLTATENTSSDLVVKLQFTVYNWHGSWRCNQGR